METLQNFIFLIIGASLTWLGSKLSKSDDTRTQLLLKIDDWVNECSRFCDYAYWKPEKMEVGDSELYEEYFKKVYIKRWIGVSKALHLDNLTSALQNLQEEMETYLKTVGKLPPLKKFLGNPDEETTIAEMYSELLDGIDRVGNFAEEIHEIIAKEMLRILPSISNYIKRFIAWIRCIFKQAE